MAGHATEPMVPRLWVAAATAVGVVLGYTLAVDPVVHSLSQVVYPVVWLAASLTVLWLVRERLADLSPVPLAVGAGYTLVLLWTAGLLGSPAGPAGLFVHFGMPGWGPAVVYTGSFLTVTVVPFLVVGYATLGVLAASALQATLQTTAAGVLGLFACVSCTAPLLAGLAGSLGAGSVAATISTAQYPLATAAFLLSAGALAVLARRGDGV
ncbi:DUF7546 family protein [Salinibaculum salinum]|uniref:DUF7546 family protein n=1 Tax=Salinibaculum salinum TaxID=3131996 RepID=UPI0030EBD395